MGRRKSLPSDRNASSTDRAAENTTGSRGKQNLSTKGATAHPSTTIGSAATTHCMKEMAMPCFSCSMPMASAARVLPRKLAFEPIMAPHARDRNSTFAYALRPTVSRSATATSIAIGNSSAAVAWLGIHMVPNAATSMRPVAKA